MTAVASRWRLQAATLALLAMIIGLPLATIHGGSRSLFQTATLLNLWLVLALLPEVLAELRSWARQRSAQLFLLVTLALLACWQQVQGPMWDVDRLWLYLSLPPLLAGLIVWFRETGEHGLLLLAGAKLPMLAIGVVWVCGRSLLAHWGYVEALPIGPAPMFRHIRNLNDEMPWALAFGALLLAGSRPTWRWLPLLALAAFGYFTAWSGSRGQLLSMVLFGLALLATRSLPLYQPAFRWAIAAAAAGLVLALVLGEGRMLLAIVGRSTGESGIGLSSGRDLIWSAALQAVTASPWTLLTGLGPDAYARLAIGAPFQEFTGPTIQPHNSLMLWWLEFGLVGLLGLLLLLARALLLALHSLRPASTLDAGNIAAALLLAQAGFSMVTGIAYHVMPLSFMLMLIAFLIARRDSQPA